VEFSGRVPGTIFRASARILINSLCVDYGRYCASPPNVKFQETRGGWEFSLAGGVGRGHKVAMIRVIAGSARGMKLAAPKQGVRPTTDRTKAALFSWLGATVEGARVLDLFAGTGGLGIEALSRGAAEAVFVEASRAAAAVLEANLARTGLAGQARVRQGTVASFLAKEPGACFDLIFADPPWVEKGADRDWVGWILEQEALPALLAPRGWFILEAPSGRKLESPSWWNAREQRRYGTTTLWFFQHADLAQDTAAADTKESAPDDLPEADQATTPA